MSPLSSSWSILLCIPIFITENTAHTYSHRSITMKSISIIFVLLVLALSLNLIHSADAARIQCADSKKVDCYIRKWRPKAIRSGICTQAIACVRSKMLQKVRSECYTDDDLGEYMGTSTPSCVSKCFHLGEDDTKKSRDGGKITVPGHGGPATEPRGFFVPHERFRNWWYTFTGHPSNI